MTESLIPTSNQRRRSLHFSAAIIRACGVALLALLVGIVPAGADEQDREYLRIYENIQEADKLDTGGKTEAAFAKYQQAYSDLVKFRKAYPTWNRDMVMFRLNYSAQKARACNEKLIAAATAAPAASGSNAAVQGQSQSASPSQGAPPPSSEAMIVKLLEPGAEPRKELRLQPKAGAKQTVALTMKMEMEQTPFTNLPAVTLNMEITIKDVSADGDISYDNVINEVTIPEEPGSPPQVMEFTKAAFSSLKGLTTSGVISSRGYGKHTEVKAPKTGTALPAAARLLKGQMDMGLATLTAPLPEEAIGKGGRWEVKMAEKSMNSISKTTYEVLSLEGDKFAVRTSGTMATVAQRTDNRSVPNLKGKGEGELTVDLGMVMPVAGNLVQTLDMSMPANTGGQGQPNAVKMKIELRIESK